MSGLASESTPFPTEAKMSENRDGEAQKQEVMLNEATHSVTRQDEHIIPSSTLNQFQGEGSDVQAEYSSNSLPTPLEELDLPPPRQNDTQPIECTNKVGFDKAATGTGTDSEATEEDTLSSDIESAPTAVGMVDPEDPTGTESCVHSRSLSSQQLVHASAALTIEERSMLLHTIGRFNLLRVHVEQMEPWANKLIHDVSVSRAVESCQRWMKYVSEMKFPQEVQSQIDEHFKVYKDFPKRHEAVVDLAETISDDTNVLADNLTFYADGLYSPDEWKKLKSTCRLESLPLYLRLVETRVSKLRAIVKTQEQILYKVKKDFSRSCSNNRTDELSYKIASSMFHLELPAGQEVAWEIETLEPDMGSLPFSDPTRQMIWIQETLLAAEEKCKGQLQDAGAWDTSGSPQPVSDNRSAKEHTMAASQITSTHHSRSLSLAETNPWRGILGLVDNIVSYLSKRETDAIVRRADSSWHGGTPLVQPLPSFVLRTVAELSRICV